MMWLWLGFCFVLRGYLYGVSRHRDRAIADRDATWKKDEYEQTVCFMLALLGVVEYPWLQLLAAICLIPVAVVLVRILLHMWDRPHGEADSVIVLGMALEDGKPNRDLLYRLDAALECGRDRNFVVTGSNTGNGRESEATVMRRVLIKGGVPKERIIMVDRAVDTLESLRNAADKVDLTRPVVLVTSGYHMLRARGLAQRLGFIKLSGMSAKCDWRFLIANLFREIVCEIGEIKKRL